MSQPDGEIGPQTFVVRVRPERTLGGGLRGFVQHVRSGHESAFADEAELLRKLQEELRADPPGSE